MQYHAGGADSTRQPATDPQTPADPHGDDGDRLHRLREQLTQQGLEVELRPGGPQLIRRRRDRWQPSQIDTDRASSSPVTRPGVNDATQPPSTTNRKGSR